METDPPDMPTEITQPNGSAPATVKNGVALGPVRLVTTEGITGGSVRYRCDHLQEQLGLYGTSATVDSTFTLPGLAPAGAVVLHRSDDCDSVQEIVQHTRAHGWPLIYGSDDLMFTADLPRKAVVSEANSVVDVPSHDTEPSSGVIGWAHQRGRARAQRSVLDACDCAVVSTEYLAERVRECDRPAFVIRNAMSREMADLSRAVRRDRSRAGGRLMLGYLSGTSTHNFDLGDIADVVAGLMQRHPHVYLTIVGPMAIPKSLQGFGTRLRCLPLVPWQDLPDLIGDLDINLAPLDMLQPFNHAKSEIKWMEAGAVGVPTIASATAGFCEAVRHGETGLLVEARQDWERGLEELVRQPDLRERLGRAARADVERHYTAEARSRQTLAVFAEIAASYTRPPDPQALASLAPLSSAGPGHPRGPLKRLAVEGRLNATQLARNAKRLASPFYWERVLRRWAGE